MLVIPPSGGDEKRQAGKPSANANAITIIMFSTPYCAPCRALSVWLEPLAHTRGMEYRKIDCMKEQAFARSAHVETTPTIMFEVGGRLITDDRLILRGLVSRDRVELAIAEVVRGVVADAFGKAVRGE